MVRLATPEHMDDPAMGVDEAALAFRFIRLVNRGLGGIAALRRVLAAEVPTWPRDRPLRWLDVGTGAADIPLAIDAWATKRGLPIECVAVDLHPSCLAVARAAVRDHPRIRVMEGDALQLSQLFPPNSFDIVHAGMFLHHLVDEDVVQVLRAMGMRASRRILWNDLVRSPFNRLAIRVLTIGSPTIVREDARLSVAKGFTLAEAVELATRAGLRNIAVRSPPLTGRLVLTASA
jgi:hypothetical protein